MAYKSLGLREPLSPLFPCPSPECLTFPYESEGDLADHLASGSHVFGPFLAAGSHAEALASNREGEGSGTGTRKGPRLATEPQLAFIRSLCERLSLSESDALALADTTGAAGTLENLSASAASDLIGILKVRAPAPSPDQEATQGASAVYRWTKYQGGWAVTGPETAIGSVVTVRKKDGSEKVATVLALLGTAQGSPCYSVREGGTQEGTQGASESAPAAAPLVPGKLYYRRDGKIVEVCLSKAGRQYGKVLSETGSRDYETGALKGIERPLTLAEAMAYGRETGICCSCGRELTNPDSIAKGIGPICESRF